MIYTFTKQNRRLALAETLGLCYAYFRKWASSLQWIKDHFWKALGIILLILLVFLAIPWGVNFGIGIASSKNWETGSNGDWIGFWGGYLGSIVGLPITVVVAIFTINSERKNNRSSRQSDELNKMIEATVTFQTQVDSFSRLEISDEDNYSIKAACELAVTMSRTQLDAFLVSYNISRTKLRSVEKLWVKQDFFTDSKAQIVINFFSDSEPKIAKIIMIINNRNISPIVKEYAEQVGQTEDSINEPNIIALNEDLKAIQRDLKNRKISEQLGDMAEEMVLMESNI